MQPFLSHSHTHQLLLIDDDLAFRETLALELSERGWLVKEAGSFDETTFRLQQQTFTHALIDLRLRSDTGLDILRLIYTQLPHCRCVMLTGYGSIPMAIEAVKLGAAEFLTKPVAIEHLHAVLKGVSGSLNAFAEQGETLEEHQRSYIDFMLLQNEGNISKAAQALGLHRQSLQRMLRKRIT